MKADLNGMGNTEFLKELRINLKLVVLLTILRGSVFICLCSWFKRRHMRGAGSPSEPLP